MFDQLLIKDNFIITNELSHVKSIEKKLLMNSFLVVNDNDGNYKGILSSIDLIQKPHFIVGDCISKRPEIDIEDDMEKIFNIIGNSIYNELPVLKNGTFLGVISKENIIDYLKTPKEKKINNTENRTESEPKIKELNLIDSNLFSIISHDLREPFNVLLGYTNYINKNYDSISEKDLKSYLSVINKTALSNFNFTQQLLNWSLKQQKGIVINKEFCNLNEIIENCLNTLTILADYKKIKIVKEINLTENTKGYFDEDIIFNVLYNIITNAIKFSDENTSIQITTFIDQENVYIKTKDEGLGIEEQLLQNLNEKKNPNVFKFNKFNNKYEGGFGLSYAKELLELYGGQLDFCSTVNKGTTVTFIIPLEFDQSKLTEEF